jgi:hypothetical protein
MSSIRDALVKKHNEEWDRSLQGGNPRQQYGKNGPPAWFWAGLLICVFALISLLTWKTYNDRAIRNQARQQLAQAAHTPTPTPIPQPIPTVTPVPQVIVVQATPVPEARNDGTDKILKELVRIQREMADIKQADARRESKSRQEDAAEIARRAASFAPDNVKTQQKHAESTVPKSSSGPPIRVDGTIGGASGRVAIIDGKTYSIGDVIKGYRITEISSSWVRCEGYDGYIEVGGAGLSSQGIPPKPAE